AYLSRGAAKYELQDYRGAIADFTKVIELDLKNSDAYSNRGVAKNGGRKEHGRNTKKGPQIRVKQKDQLLGRELHGVHPKRDGISKNRR
ncbi:MAG: tetratricopeptide repeat protein, partial [Congregibacter sp.]|nr:tetratricopeptide repeat protein [Congregibacter sp.]